MKDLKVLTKDGISYVIPEDRVTNEMLKCGCPEGDLWLIEDSTIEAAEHFYGIDTIMDLSNGKEYKRCIYYHESGVINYFAGYNNEKEYREACWWLTKMLKPGGDE